MTIDNFDIIRSYLTFESQFDRYIIHILKRAKDEDGKKYGVNTTNSLIKSFYISSLEYFDKKIPVIKDLCESYNARAYILPQVRNNSNCMREMLKIIVDNIDNPTIKPDTIAREAYCGFHGSRDKKWIIDLDEDNLTEYISNKKTCDETVEIDWTPDEVLKFIKKQLVEIGKSEDEAYMIPTKNGHCIITTTFNLQNAYEKCTMMFQGEQKRKIGVRHTGPGESEDIMKNITGWLIKDGMALLYFNDGKNN